MILSFRRMTVAALVLVLAASAAFAQGPGPQRGRGPGALGPGIPVRALNLTEAQREQMQTITRQHHQQSRTLIERLRAAQGARQQAVDTLPLDEGRIRAAMQDLAAVEADLAVAQARLRSDLFAILTPEQQAEAEKLRADRDARRKARQDRIQERLKSRLRPQA